jgi:hypothetical protein
MTLSLIEAGVLAGWRGSLGARGNAPMSLWWRFVARFVIRL